MMIPIPAIDLKGGKVVRLLQGNFQEEKVYFEDPEIVAHRFEEEGAARLHVVDLDGALKGSPRNVGQIEKILRRVKMPVEVGGGIRTVESAALYFGLGASWVVLGTKACLDKGFMEEAIREFKERVIIGIDARDGFIATDGWTKLTAIKAVDFVKQVEALGGRAVIYTDISKDGALKGPNLKEILALARAVSIDVIASGGVGSLEDLKNILALKQPNLTGVIIGKAIYEKRFSLKDAAAALGG